MTATIIYWTKEKRYGFCKDGGGESYFFHQSDVSNPEDISENRILEFTVEDNVKGLKCVLASVVPF